MNLFHREIGEGSPIVILHGLFGSSDNWLSIAKVLSETHKVYTVDQRNHGQSPHSDEFNYPMMADDLKGFIEEHQIVNPIIIGHSMGGKVAMQFAVNNPAMLEKLIIVDIGPKAYPVHHDRILEGLCALPMADLKSRGDADKHLAEYVSDMGTRQFLLKNIGRNSEGFFWKINLSVIRDNIEIIGHGLQGDTFDKPTFFINGKNSNYIVKGDQALIEEHFPNVEFSTIENAGHWVHAEQPADFLKVVMEFID
jgi:pimeloyl-ACP methyl ester carboxylesterase